MMKPEKMKCECCKKHEHQWVLTDTLNGGATSYFVCGNCMPALINYRLSRKQFRNLVKAGHSMEEFLLHEDFYDEDGTALQPFYEGTDSFR